MDITLKVVKPKGKYIICEDINGKKYAIPVSNIKKAIELGKLDGESTEITLLEDEYFFGDPENKVIIIKSNITSEDIL